MPWIWDEFAYGSRLAWVRTKDILGFQRSGTDRSFYIAQLVRKLRSGELGRNISITAAGTRTRSRIDSAAMRPSGLPRYVGRRSTDANPLI